VGHSGAVARSLRVRGMGPFGPSASRVPALTKEGRATDNNTGNPSRVRHSVSVPATSSVCPRSRASDTPWCARQPCLTEPANCGSEQYRPTCPRARGPRASSHTITAGTRAQFGTASWFQRRVGRRFDRARLLQSRRHEIRAPARTARVTRSGGRSHAVIGHVPGDSVLGQVGATGPNSQLTACVVRSTCRGANMTRT